MSGQDIFISYARADADAARRFAEAFRAEGLGVWWDDSLQAGEVFDEAIETALRAAKAVVVLWSPDAVASRWVRAEATLADRNKTLVPALIAPCQRPIVFELTQTADLCHWRGEAADRRWQSFVADVRRVAGQAAKAPAAPRAPLPRLDQLSIVVLPFANMSHDPEQDYFADGISEDIITDLSKVSALLVIARNTAFTFKGKAVDVGDVARQLNVTHVLEGSVRKSGNRVRVTAQLIDGSTGGHVWADRYDRDLDDIFALQDELSEAIVGALKVKLLPEEKKAIEDRGTASVEAYDLFLRTWEAYRSGDGYERALATGRAAVAIDPNFARCWKLLAGTCRIGAYFLPGQAAALYAEAEAAFERAVALETDPVKAHLTRGSMLCSVRYDWLGAEQAYAEAARLAPGRHMEADFDRGILLAHVGRLADAIEDYRACMRLDPMVAAPVFNLMLDAAGRREEADAEYQRECRIGTALPTIHFYDVLRLLAREDREAARRRFARFLAGDASFFPRAAEVFAAFDDPARVRVLLREAADDPDFGNPTHLTSIALVAAWADDSALALRCLRTAFVDMRVVTIAILWHPLLAAVRRTEGFRQIMRALGQYDYWRRSGNWSELARPVGEDDFEMIG